MFAFLIILILIVGSTHGATVNVAASESDNSTVAACEDYERCVPYYQCLENDGGGIFNIRAGLDSSELDLSTVPCESLRQCCGIENINEEIPQSKTHATCGYRNAEGLGYFSLGKYGESQFGEFPWMMAILERLDFGDNQLLAFLAGGSLIHPLIVLTTAHNLQNASADLLVRGGEWNTQSVDEMLPHVERDVISVSYHNQFVRKNLQNDIALAFLKKPFEIAPHINTICLPELNQASSASNCIATGWGKKKFGSREQYQVFLKKVELPIVPRDTCQEQLRLTRLGEDFELHDGFLCAGGVDGVDTCTGDGGSPLICPIAGRKGYYYQAGIVVGGIGCGEKDVPAFYVDVAKYKTWIVQQAIAKRIIVGNIDMRNVFE